MPQINLGKRQNQATYPHLLSQQASSFQEILTIGATPEEKKTQAFYKILQQNFPIADSKRNIVINLVDYIVGAPASTPQECQDAGITYGVPITLKVQVVCSLDGTKTISYEEIFLGTIPYMTPNGSFVYKGIERVITPQLCRSHGVFFSQSLHASGAKLYSAKIIPAKGTWVEFLTNANQVMYAYVDRRGKFPFTMLLRAIGFGTDRDILNLFGLAEEIKATPKNLRANLGKKLAARVLRIWTEEFVDEETSEVISLDRSEIILDRDTVLDEDNIEKILQNNTRTILLHKNGIPLQSNRFAYNTLQKDNTNSTKEAVELIYYHLRGTEPPDEEAAHESIKQLLFSEQRAYLGKIGRYSLNRKLNNANPSKSDVLIPEDIVDVIKHLFEFINGRAPSDDVDHLSNRLVRTIKKQFTELLTISISRIARQAAEKINVRNNDEKRAIDFISNRPLASAINTFFSSNPLVQLTDSLNPLSQISHRRRMSTTGPGGLSRNRATIEARDVHSTQYGRICPIKTSEGQNIGLVLALPMHAKIDDMGLIRTPYRKVKDGKVDFGSLPIYLTADEEEKCCIAQATEPLDQDGKFINKKLEVRRQADFLIVDAKEVSYVDISPDQIASFSTSLIPFVEHNDSARALMGSNMQCQAVPLTKPKAPIVGTGHESRVVHDFPDFIKAEGEGTITYVDAEKIVITYDDPGQLSYNYLKNCTRTYQLAKFKGNSQGSCINLEPIVYKGDRVTKDQILCQGYATEQGRLALGQNLNVAYLSYRGDSFEDGVVMSNRVVEEDLLTSIHIKEFTVDLRTTKAGPQEFTNDIPNVSDKDLENLDDRGLVRVGTKIKEGNILVGKVAPKVESTLSMEATLLKAIFGSQAYNVKNISLLAPPSFEGTVIKTKLLKRVPRDKYTKTRVKKEIGLLCQNTDERLQYLYKELIKQLIDLLQKQKLHSIRGTLGNTILSSRCKVNAENLSNLFDTVESNLQLSEARPLKSLASFSFTKDKNINIILQRLLQSYEVQYQRIVAQHRKKHFALEVGDSLPSGVIEQAKVYVAQKRKLQVGDKIALRHGSKGVVSRIVSQEDMPYFADGTRVDIILNPLSIPSRMNPGQLMEVGLGWAGQQLSVNYDVPIFNSPGQDRILEEMERAGLPSYGCTTLYDSLTGEPFDQEVACGNVYVLKLKHLIDDKIHARSTGPYAMITQQPLGGRHRFGGQRLGEMEVAALAAYGAAKNLSEMLTYKSDDVSGRRQVFEALVKGKPLPHPGTPESAKVVLQTLNGLGIEVNLQ